MEFKVIATDGKARVCSIKTAHSEFLTPIFMPVGTKASIKGLDSVDINNLGAKIILANTYHLYLRPTPKLIKEFGGLHGFSKFSGSFLTDSGGFQAFSLAGKPDENGISFKDYKNGNKHYFTPKSVLECQYDFNSDIMMVLDDLVDLGKQNNPKRIKQSLDRTIRWAKESLEYHKSMKDKGLHTHQNLFAILQGGCEYEARRECANSLCGDDFDGFAIGGLSVGEETQAMYDTVEFTTEFMPKHKPRYLMGVGKPENLVENVYLGVDMFDCVLPTRNARNGTLYGDFGKIEIKKDKFKNDPNPIEIGCNCHTCQNYSRAYLHHLFKEKEISFFRLASIHNIAYFLRLSKAMQDAIIEQRFESFRREFYAKWCE